VSADLATGAAAVLVGGSWLTTDGPVLPVVDPATGDTVALVPESGAAIVAQAVRAAADALPAWGASHPTERATIIAALADLLEAASEDVVRSVGREMGMPAALARASQVVLPTAALRATAELVRSYDWSVEHEGYTVHREAAGVVAAVTPWNMPVHQVLAKIGPALAAGCTVVLKPSELAPSTALLLGLLALQAGLPAGVLNVVTGTGGVTGEALISHPLVDVVSFTGSLAVGRHIGAVAGGAVKRVALELGGKSASLVLDDADLEVAVAAAVRAAFVNSGQACNAPTRLLVPRGRLLEAEQLAVRTAQALRLGTPEDPSTDLGPLVSKSQRERVLGHVRNAVADGAHLLTGSTEPVDGPGSFVLPTVFGGVTPDMRLWREEVFGPVLAITPHDGDEHATTLANDSDYGLSAEIWSPSADRVALIARRLRVGQVKVNGVHTRSRPTAPFGGMKLSGLGRELGVHGLEEFLEVKAVLT
jgi:acyl-CoA reductase-like NAD-dependent aldehyde dehydrogenase